MSEHDPDLITLLNVEPEDTERIEEFFRRKLAEGGHMIPLPMQQTPKHRADTDDALLAVSVPGKHKAEDWEEMFRLSRFMRDVAVETGRPVMIQSNIRKNSRDFESPS